MLGGEVGRADREKKRGTACVTFMNGDGLVWRFCSDVIIEENIVGAERGSFESGAGEGSD